MNTAEKLINDLDVSKLMLCNSRTLTPELCIRIGQAINSAIDLLKEQEPRVLTLEEIKDYDKPVWIDEKGWGSWKLPFYAFDLDLYVIFGHECFLIGDYGKEWLPWTSQPTDEQRKAVKWDD